MSYAQIFDCARELVPPISALFKGQLFKRQCHLYEDCNHGISLVAQWLGVRLPMQETRVRALVWEDPTCRGATKPVRLNC